MRLFMNSRKVTLVRPSAQVYFPKTADEATLRGIALAVERKVS